MIEQFTYAYYESLLWSFKKAGYTFGAFTDKTHAPKTVYLRHDIDLTLEYLPAMVDVEQALGVFSTCFILVNNEFYNILAPQNMAIIQQCRDKGTVFGLHVDPNFIMGEASSFSFPAFIGNLEAVFQFYSRYIPLAPVISWHRPATYIKDEQMYDKIGRFINAYEPRFFKQAAYVADSNRRRFWQETRLGQALAQNQTIQLATHPFWWREQEQTDENLFAQMLQVGANTARYTMTSNIKRYM